ncbi:hypothetical protein AB0C12_21165 [Actinoplanes sp. NPDC048967]|uniref:hypothetical protein n=1 Tax=Actinoplanes sp. NPDC048967 TaxID=3155269 RepID=UPI0033E9A0F4
MSPYPPAAKREYLKRLGGSWRDLADEVGMPRHEYAGATDGDGPRVVWDWLADRKRLAGLPEALRVIGRGDLVAELEALAVTPRPSGPQVGPVEQPAAKGSVRRGWRPGWALAAMAGLVALVACGAIGWVVWNSRDAGDKKSSGVDSTQTLPSGSVVAEVDVRPPDGEQCCGPDLAVEFQTTGTAPRGRTLWLCVSLTPPSSSITYYFPQQSVSSRPGPVLRTVVHVDRAAVGSVVRVFVASVDQPGSATLQAMLALDDGAGDWSDRAALPPGSLVVSAGADVRMTHA